MPQARVFCRRRDWLDLADAKLTLMDLYYTDRPRIRARGRARGHHEVFGHLGGIGGEDGRRGGAFNFGGGDTRVFF